MRFLKNTFSDTSFLTTDSNFHDLYKILEDVFEAFIGALFLDQSYDIAKQFIINVIERYVDFTDILLTDTNRKRS